MAAHQRIASFKRPPSSLKGGGATSKSHLFWEAEQLLYIGWGCSLRVRAHARTFCDGSLAALRALCACQMLSESMDNICALCMLHMSSGGPDARLAGCEGHDAADAGILHAAGAAAGAADGRHLRHGGCNPGALCTLSDGCMTTGFHLVLQWRHHRHAGDVHRLRLTGGGTACAIEGCPFARRASPHSVATSQCWRRLPRKTERLKRRRQ